MTPAETAAGTAPPAPWSSVPRKTPPEGDAKARGTHNPSRHQIHYHVTFLLVCLFVSRHIAPHISATRAMSPITASPHTGSAKPKHHEQNQREYQELRMNHRE